MSSRIWITATLVTASVTLYWINRASRERESPTEVAVTEAPKAPAGIVEDLSERYLRGYASPESDIQRDLAQLREVIDALVTSVKVPGALPTSGNRDIVTALAGGNAYRIRFLDPAAGHTNARGEIIDRWGTPVYFHFVEATDPSLRSAGPDRTMWTEDDVVNGGESKAR